MISLEKPRRFTVAIPFSITRCPCIVREMGYHSRVFDLLDERRLNKDEFQRTACVALWSQLWTVPRNVVPDWSCRRAVGNCEKGRKAVESNDKETDTIESDMKKLNKCYGGGGFSLFRKN